MEFVYTYNPKAIKKELTGLPKKVWENLHNPELSQFPFNFIYLIRTGV